MGALTFWVQIILQSCVIHMNCYHFVHPVRSFKMHEMRLSKATNVQEHARKHFLTANEDYKYYITKTVALILNCMLLTFFINFDVEPSVK